MEAGFSSLIPLLIFVAIAIISSILQKKSEPGAGESDLPRRRPGTEPGPKSWEEQLRDLLENRTPAPPPLPRPHRPPPPVVRQPPRSMPPPPTQSSPQDTGIEVHLPAPRPHLPPSFQRLPGLTESHQHYGQAATLQSRTAQHMQDVTRHAVGTTSVGHQQSLAKIEARDLFRDPRSVRAAVMAGIILGPPRAFDEY